MLYHRICDICGYDWWSEEAFGDCPKVLLRERNMDAFRKKCPFCGSFPRTSVKITSWGSNDGTVEFSVYCPECHVSKSKKLQIGHDCEFLAVEEVMDDAMDEWNRRAEK